MAQQLCVVRGDDLSLVHDYAVGSRYAVCNKCNFVLGERSLARPTYALACFASLWPVHFIRLQSSLRVPALPQASPGGALL